MVSTASWPQKLNINFFRDGGSGSLHIQPLSFCQQLIIRIQIVSLVLSKNGLLLPFQELLFVRCEGYSLGSFAEILVWLECNRNLDSGVWLPEVLSPCCVCFSQYQSCGLVINIIYPPSSLRDLPSQVMFP